MAKKSDKKETVIVNAEQRIISIIQDVIKKADKATLLASCKALNIESTEILSMFGKVDYKQDEQLLAMALVATKKASFIKYAKLVLQAVLTGTGNEAALKARAVEVELAKLAGEIMTSIDSAMSSTLLIGKNLSIALLRIKDIGGKQADFLAWSSENCSIGKAQAYKLMAVYNTFGDISEYSKVSMRVLYSLIRQSDKVKENAKALASKGKLDTKALDRLIKEHAPVKVVPAVSTPTANDNPSPAVESALKLGGVVAESGSSVTSENQEPSNAPNIVHAMDAQEITIESLKAIIEDLKEQLSKSQVIRRESSLPYLPQFDSKVPCTVLGLEASHSGNKEAINKAYRAMAKIYTKAKAEQAASKLLTARDTLISEIK